VFSYLFNYYVIYFVECCYPNENLWRKTHLWQTDLSQKLRTLLCWILTSNIFYLCVYFFVNSFGNHKIKTKELCFFTFKIILSHSLLISNWEIDIGISLSRHFIAVIWNLLFSFVFMICVITFWVPCCAVCGTITA
jgi:hypothetical protein